jgi:ribosomal-protein-alanine N-acetyltransferase
MLRLPQTADRDAWLHLRQESRAALQPFEPLWSEADLTKAGFAARVRLARRLAEEGAAYQFLVFDRRGAPLLGGITLGNIKRGASQTAQVGYWLGTEFEGRGHMSDALLTVLRFAFGNLRLHRVEAASMPENRRSIALLERCGFRHEGTARAYLEINGRRPDHELYSCLPGDAGFNAPMARSPSD